MSISQGPQSLSGTGSSASLRCHKPQDVIRMKPMLRLFLASCLSCLCFTALPALAQAPVIGIVLMHGKGGSPNKHVNTLADKLQEQGYLVANLNMPWSGARDYDVDTDAADKQVEEAFATLKTKGAQKVFVSGHSLGGTFALHYASKYPVDGVIAIAPGGSTGSQVYLKEVASSIEQAQKLVAEGKGGEKNRFDDFETSKGLTPVLTTAANYLSWFSSTGAMNNALSAKQLPTQTPVLWIVAKRDYPGLIRFNVPFFRNFEGNSQSRLYRPDSDHLGAPAASVDEIRAWTQAVANGTLK